ncbi:cupin domain-containing protein [Ramlibacter sp. AN1015]|uniref:cupin domain-containing protein n=1 Tax=Ramlibacter sp. AN1015 TaxID=3133428 RepID=UPI0030BD6028
MSRSKPLAVIRALDLPLRQKPTSYPEPFASRMARRQKRPVGDAVGLRNFGVNLTTILPGGESALQHAHSAQDEFVYVLEGTLVLVHEHGEAELSAGMCAGFPAGGGAHHLVNRSAAPATVLEIGDRSEGDAVRYPRDDLEAAFHSGCWHFRHKDGTPY